MEISLRPLMRFVRWMMIFYILTQVFAYALSFADVLYRGGMWQQQLIDLIYLVRNLAFFGCIGVVVLSLRIRFDAVLVLIFFVAIYMEMSLMFPGNKKYFKEIQPLMKYYLAAYCLIRTELISFQMMKKSLIWGSRIVLAVILYAFLSNLSRISVESVYMTFANAISMAIAILIYSAMMDDQLIDYIEAGVGLFMLLSYGSRGALMTLLLLIAYLIWIKYESPKLVAIALASAGAAMLILPVVLSALVKALVQAGVGGRTLEKLLSGEMMKSGGRSMIYQYLFEVFGENLLTGVGVCGDRYYLPKKFKGVNATYAHNLVLEIYLDFGIIVGTIILYIICWLLFSCFIKETNPDKKGLFSAFVFVAVVQLMTSRSWTTEQNFWILFALLLSYSSKRNTLMRIRITR